MPLMVGLKSNGGIVNLLHAASAPAPAAGDVEDDGEPFGVVLLLMLLEFSLASLILPLQLLP